LGKFNCLVESTRLIEFCYNSKQEVDWRLVGKVSCLSYFAVINLKDGIFGDYEVSYLSYFAGINRKGGMFGVNYVVKLVTLVNLFTYRGGLIKLARPGVALIWILGCTSAPLIRRAVLNYLLLKLKLL